MPRRSPLSSDGFLRGHHAYEAKHQSCRFVTDHLVLVVGNAGRPRGILPGLGKKRQICLTSNPASPVIRIDSEIFLRDSVPETWSEFPQDVDLGSKGIDFRDLEVQGNVGSL